MLTQDVDLANIATMGSVNLTYAIICIIIGIIAMVAGYKLFDMLSAYDTAKELSNGNMAVAVFNGLVVLGIGICSGLVIGLSCN